MKSIKQMGILYVVSTPIGNLGDITLRALSVLGAVDYILCEDTRVCGKLLSKYKIDKKMISFGDYNENSKKDSVIGDLSAGKNVALVADAGTPLVSDPGYKLVREAIGRGITIEVIAGASAVLTSLVVSGLPPDKFCFIGYLPKKGLRRKEVLEKVKEVKEILKMTAIMFESPHRLVDALADIQEVFGDSDLVICRELTKLHEEVRREKVSMSLAYFSQNAPKGELTILL